MKRKKRKSGKRCRPTYRISEAGHLLATEGDSDAGSTLSKDGKREKRKRRKRGCLSGAAIKDRKYKLTARQKKYLPKALQRAILKYHGSKG